MSDDLYTAADAFRRAQSHCGAVALSPRGESAGSAREGSHRQLPARESRPAPRAGQRPGGVRHQRRSCQRPRATFDQPCLGRTYRGNLIRHGGRSQEPRFVAPGGDHRTSGDNTLGPDSVVMLGLPRARPRRLGGLAPGRPQAAVRSPLRARPAAPGHPRLGPAQFGGHTPLEPEAGEPGRCGPPPTLSPPCAAHRWRSLQTMSRDSSTPRPGLTMARAIGFSGTFR
jgi:hypothetical protein